jgi:hypothetical protein
MIIKILTKCISSDGGILLFSESGADRLTRTRILSEARAIHEVLLSKIPSKVYDELFSLMYDYEKNH